MGTAGNVDWVEVCATPLAVDVLEQWAARPECGAVVTFRGITRRSSSTGQDITELEYETSVDLAEGRMREVIAAARERWPEIVAVAIHHRIGRVILGQPAVAIVVSSAHRGQAFAAAQYCIDTVKKSVPMWKREVWSTGSAWSQEAHDIVSVHDA